MTRSLEYRRQELSMAGQWLVDDRFTNRERIDLTWALYRKARDSFHENKNHLKNNYPVALCLYKSHLSSLGRTCGRLQLLRPFVSPGPIEHVTIERELEPLIAYAMEDILGIISAYDIVLNGIPSRK